MFIRGRLQWSLLIICLLSGVIALVLARNDSRESAVPVETTTTSTTPPETTTTYVEPVYYMVKSGDTLFNISKRFNLDMLQLMQLNGISNPNHVEVGQNLKLPPATGFIPVAPSTTMAP
ncbi:MAG: LysM peptidoglycan-binding domain-containing protein [Ilumatobacteraceae bacterium]